MFQKTALIIMQDSAYSRKEVSVIWYSNNSNDINTPGKIGADVCFSLKGYIYGE
jgi:hypothetical protein